MKINKTFYDAMRKAGIHKSLEAMSEFKLEKIDEEELTQELQFQRQAKGMKKVFADDGSFTWEYR